jgi:hypothetical protein
MNYFAHALRFLDRPVFAVATGLPDMLSVVDRSMRLRSKRVEPFISDTDPFRAEVAAGILQHLQDDDWFHTTQACLVTSSDLTRLFRRIVGESDGARCPFLGHIVTELQLDAALSEAYPQSLDRYYELMDQIDAARVEADVNVMATKTSDRLARLIAGFVREQFLRDYRTPASLRFRLNQVMLRVGLDQLPEHFDEALAASWEIVRQRVDGLLPAAHFTMP